MTRRAVKATKLAVCAALALDLALPTAARSRPPYTSRPGVVRPVARFEVAYSGAGTYATRYHSEPPNPGGMHDTNDASDSSTERWALRFGRPLTIPRCGPAPRGGPDRCLGIASLTSPRGSESATGQVAHVHVDGLFTAQNGSVACRVQARTSRRRPPRATVEVRYDRRLRVVAFRALDPVASVLDGLPTQCPGAGDSLDGLLDNYLAPGFSFAPGHGRDPWFASGTVRVPAAVLRRAAVVRIPLGPTPAGTPPPGCAVAHPAFERCTTGGSWAGVLTLTAR